MVGKANEYVSLSGVMGRNEKKPKDGRDAGLCLWLSLFLCSEFSFLHQRGTSCSSHNSACTGMLEAVPLKPLVNFYCPSSGYFSFPVLLISLSSSSPSSPSYSSSSSQVTFSIFILCARHFLRAFYSWPHTPHKNPTNRYHNYLHFHMQKLQHLKIIATHCPFPT